jgi:hypothetical protein
MFGIGSTENQQNVLILNIPQGQLDIVQYASMRRLFMFLA